MSALSKFLRRCRKPSGFFGKLVARGMNSGFQKLTDWGLEQITIEGRQYHP